MPQSEKGAPEDFKIYTISYSQDEYEVKEAESASECIKCVGKRNVTWIRIIGKPNAEILNNIGEQFGFHQLAIDDVINADQRPKVEQFDKYIFITVNIPQRPENSSSIRLDQVCIFLGTNFIMTVNSNGSIFEPVRQRIEEDRGRIRKMNADYLAYTLIDIAVDQYFPILDFIETQIESIDEVLQAKPSHQMVREIRRTKRYLFLIRSSVWPMREVISNLQREEPHLITDVSRLYLRDAYNHTIQIADMVESCRDILSEMFNMYLSMTANSTNEVMKVLTIFASIFIPLTFIVGIYGMNFKFMPELNWRPAYFIVHGIMIVVAIAMLRFFRKRGWF